jgi:hypothetical protein
MVFREVLGLGATSIVVAIKPLPALRHRIR